MPNQTRFAFLFTLFALVFIFTAVYLIQNDPLGWFENKGGNFLVYWLSIRAFGKESLSPYDQDVQAATVELVYGNADAPADPGLKFSSPLYSVLMILPFALIKDAQTARLVWLVFSELVLAVCLWFCLRLTGWKPAAWLLFFVFVFSLLGYHSIQALGSGNIIILGFLFVLSSFLAIRSQRYELAGILLALATIQPGAVFFVLLFVLFWSFSRRLWPVIVWFFAGIAILSILGLFFIPNWPLQYLRVIFNFGEYFPIINPVSVFSSGLPGMGRQLGWGFSLIIGIILILEWLAARRRDFGWFLWTASLTFTLSPWLGLPADPNDFILLLLPFILILAMWDQRFEHFGKWMAVSSILVLLVGFWLIFVQVMSGSDPGQANGIFLFLFPLFLLIGLYWVRWWSVRAQKDYVEVLRSVDKF
jgi:hypothetical protein